MLHRSASFVTYKVYPDVTFKEHSKCKTKTLMAVTLQSAMAGVNNLLPDVPPCL